MYIVNTLHLELRSKAIQVINSGLDDIKKLQISDTGVNRLGIGSHPHNAIAGDFNTEESWIDLSPSLPSLLPTSSSLRSICCRLKSS